MYTMALKSAGSYSIMSTQLVVGLRQAYIVHDSRYICLRQAYIVHE